MAEVSVVAQPEINPFATIVGIGALAFLTFVTFEVIKFEPTLKTEEQKLFHIGASQTSTGNQNPGTVSQSPQLPASGKAPTVTQNLVTVSKVDYGDYKFLPLVAELEGRKGSNGVIYPGPCEQVTADVTLKNNTSQDYNVTVYGYLIPSGSTPSPSNAAGHFWPDNASGVVSGTPYKGIYPGKVLAHGTLTTSNVATAPMQVPNTTYGVLWQIYITGQSAYTSQRFDQAQIENRFTTKPTCTQG